ncbi:MAG: hypothetical protein ACRD40_14855 [Candidatus Acidiferrales bacterium]
MKKLAGTLVCIAVLCAVPIVTHAQEPPAQEPASQAPEPQAPTPQTTTLPSPTPEESSSTPSSTPPAHSAEQYNTRTTPMLEVSGGYSYRAYSPTPSTTVKLNGGFASVDYNLLSWVGIAAEGSATVRKEGAQSLGTSQTLTIFTGLVGPQIYPLRHRKLTVFTHILIGDGYYYTKAPAFGGFSANVTTNSGFAWEVGGGMDVRIKKHWSIRLIEGDYGETSFSVAGANAHQVGYRISAGIVYLIGEK